MQDTSGITRGFISPRAVKKKCMFMHLSFFHHLLVIKGRGRNLSLCQGQNECRSEGYRAFAGNSVIPFEGLALAC